MRQAEKWRLWQTSKDGKEAEQKQKARPTGNKKAKHMDQDRALVASIVKTGEKEEDKKQSARDRPLQEAGTSMNKVGGTMDAVVASELMSIVTGLHHLLRPNVI